MSVDKAKNGTHLLYRDGVIRNVSVGGYIKIAKGFSYLVAKVEGESVTEDIQKRHFYQTMQDRVGRTLNVSLLGFIDSNGEFRRGVRELPLIDNECYLLTQAEFDLVHTFVGPGDAAITIGKLALERGQDVHVGVDALFASHVGIFGNTGSGKSYTLAKLYFELLKAFGDSTLFTNHAKFVLVDFNGEYIDEGVDSTPIASDPQKRSFKLTTRRNDGDRLPVSRASINDHEMWSVLFEATPKTQAPFIKRALGPRWKAVFDDGGLKYEVASLLYLAVKRSESGDDKAAMIDLLDEVQTCLGGAESAELADFIALFRTRLNWHSQSRVFFWQADDGGRLYANQDDHDQALRKELVERFSALDIPANVIGGLNLIRCKLVLQFYSDVFRGFANKEHLSPLMKRMETRLPSIEKLLVESEAPLIGATMTVISLRDVNLDMKKVIPLLVCKQLYDEKKQAEDGNSYLNLIIDEAHNILSDDSFRESESWKDYRLETFEEIVKEGRKFGVFLTIASQRPHDISQTIISQLHNYLLHRLVNNLDIHAVEKAVSYLDRVAFESLPILPTGTCILSGVCAQVPVVIEVSQIQPAEFEPRNKTMTLSDKWRITLGAGSASGQ